MVLTGEVAEGEEDRQVEGEDLAAWVREYLARLRSDARKAIDLLL